jgi:electron transfer flavoprotein alpha subunit
MTAILAFALHYEGAFNKNSLGGVSEAARLASESPTTSPPRWGTTA